jgi:hypothetical protein
MENELLRNQLQSTRNILQTLVGNIDNTLLAYNQVNRTYSRNRTDTARRNLNNLYQELRNMYPTSSNLNRNNSNSTNLNSTNLNSTNLNSTNLNSTNLNGTGLNSNLRTTNLNTYNRNTNLDYSTDENNLNRTSTPLSTSLNNTLNNLINSRLSSTGISNQPDMIEVTLYNNGNTISNMEDVSVYPSLRTLSRASDVYRYEDIETEYESCTICRERFQSNSIIRKLQCGHIFHIGCIDQWFENNVRCPVCRTDLRDYDNEETEDEDNSNIPGVANV